MIKRIAFASRRPDLTRASFASTWPDAVAACSEAPVAVRPVRVTVATSLAQLIPGEPTHDGVVSSWFTDDEHLAQFDTWLETAHGRSVRTRIAHLVDAGSSPEVVVDEAILRGDEWLDRRWQEGSEQLKHLALARGIVGPSVTGDPDDGHGQAFVRNLARAVDAPAYTSVDEIYFDDLDDLRARIASFDPVEVRDGDELVGAMSALAVREAVVLPVSARV